MVRERGRDSRPPTKDNGSARRVLTLSGCQVNKTAKLFSLTAATSYAGKPASRLEKLRKQLQQGIN